MALGRIWYIAGLYLCLLTLSPATSRARYQSVKTTNFAVAFVSDYHQGVVPCETVGAWLAAQDPPPQWVLHAGDVYLDDAHGMGSWNSLVSAFPGATVFTALGNHDFGHSTSSPECLPEDPYGTGLPFKWANSTPGFSGLPYHSEDLYSVRVLFLDNDYDTLRVGSEVDWIYSWCDPPCACVDNPDYANWVSADTTLGQLAWIKGRLQNFGGGWVIAIAHRSPYTPYDQDACPIRVLDRAGRSTAWAMLSRLGVDLAVTGDTHTHGLSDRLYEGQVSSVGTYFLSSHFGATARTMEFGVGVASSSLSESMMLWPKEADLAGQNADLTNCVVGYAVFHGDRMTLKVVQDDGSGTVTVRYTLYAQRRER